MTGLPFNDILLAARFRGGDDGVEEREDVG